MHCFGFIGWENGVFSKSVGFVVYFILRNGGIFCHQVRINSHNITSYFVYGYVFLSLYHPLCMLFFTVLFIEVQGVINVSSTYDSRTQELESSLVARGDLWRVEASCGSSTSGNENSSLFLFQLGPLLLVRDSTLLLPVHLSKQHLLWYGYDRKVSVIFSWLSFSVLSNC